MHQSHIQLGLTPASSSPIEDIEPLLHLADRLLQLLASGALGESLDTADFRRTIEKFRRVLPGATTSGSLADLTAECLDTCEQFQRQSQTYLADRASDFLELIELLRTAVATVARGSLGYEQQIEASTERLAQSAQLDDLAELRRTIQEEVASIKQTTSERHDREAAAFRQLTDRVETLEAQLVEAQDEAATDPLTGTPNRGAFERVLRCRLHDARAGTPFVLAWLQLDDFPRINDTHGRMVGDRVLLCLGQVLTSALGSDDFVARVGGEEFAVVMTGISLDRATKRLAAARQSLAPSYRYEAEGKPVHVGFTYCCGVTEYVSGDSAASILRRTDDAMRAAQRRGKDRIVARRHSLLRGLFHRSKDHRG